MMNIKVAASYSEDKVREIIDAFGHSGKTYWKKRNTIKVFEVGDEKWNVKSFQVPHLINRFFQPFFAPGGAPITTMRSHHVQQPDSVPLVMSWRASLAFLGGLVACLCAGTLFSVSAYAPVLKTQLNMTQTQVSGRHL